MLIHSTNVTCYLSVCARFYCLFGLSLALMLSHDSKLIWQDSHQFLCDRVDYLWNCQRTETKKAPDFSFFPGLTTQGSKKSQLRYFKDPSMYRLSLRVTSNLHSNFADARSLHRVALLSASRWKDITSPVLPCQDRMLKSCYFSIFLLTLYKS